MREDMDEKKVTNVCECTTFTDARDILRSSVVLRTYVTVALQFTVSLARTQRSSFQFSLSSTSTGYGKVHEPTFNLRISGETVMGSGASSNTDWRMSSSSDKVLTVRARSNAVRLLSHRSPARLPQVSSRCMRPQLGQLSGKKQKMAGRDSDYKVVGMVLEVSRNKT